jgi:hypothetical protein
MRVERPCAKPFLSMLKIVAETLFGSLDLFV